MQETRYIIMESKIFENGLTKDYQTAVKEYVGNLMRRSIANKTDDCPFDEDDVPFLVEIKITHTPEDFVHEVRTVELACSTALDILTTNYSEKKTEIWCIDDEEPRREQ